jgi:hypothetical protein
MVATDTEHQPSMPSSATPWQGMPARMKVLHITTPQRTGGWLAEAFAADSATQVLLEEVVGQAALLVSHEPGEIDALDLIEGYRAGGAEEPIVVLGAQSEPEMAILCYEVGADGYVCVHASSTRNLIWVVARAVQRHELIDENRRFHQAEQSRLQRENDEARRLLQEQWALVVERDAGSETADARGVSTETRPDVMAFPPELIAHYRELLRTYVMMGSGNLSDELRRLAEVLVGVGLSAQQTVALHLQVVEEMVHGLGARSSRHAMTRADVLAVEIMMYLGEGYRRRYEELFHPPMQRLLPGFG